MASWLTKNNNRGGCCLMDMVRKKVFIVQQNSTSNKGKKWGFPKGRYEKTDETILKTALRELNEEVKGIPKTLTLNCLNKFRIKQISIYVCYVDSSKLYLSPNSREISDCKWIPITDLYIDYMIRRKKYNLSIAGFFNKWCIQHRSLKHLMKK